MKNVCPARTELDWYYDGQEMSAGDPMQARQELKFAPHEPDAEYPDALTSDFGHLVPVRVCKHCSAIYAVEEKS